MVSPRRLSALAASIAAVALGSSAQASPPDWAGVALGQDLRGPSSSARVSADDLLRLRELGGLSLSPDGRLLAFSVRQADVEANRYAMRWFIAPTDGSRSPVPVEIDSGQPIPAYSYGQPQAYIPLEHAKWSPDQRWLAFRRMVDHRIELWIVNNEGKQATRISSGNPQVASFSWLSSNTILFRTGLNYDKFETQLNRESRNGWLFDGRIVLSSSLMRPGLPDCGQTNLACDNRDFAYVIGGGVRSADDQDMAAKAKNDAEASGASISTPPIDPRFGNAIRPIRRISTNVRGAPPCNGPFCVGARFNQFGWVKEGKSIWFLKNEGSTGSPDGEPADRTALYEWTLRTGKVRKVYEVDGVLADCSVHMSSAFCTEELATTPPRVVSVELVTGSKRILADPNPMFVQKTYPKIEKLIVRDSDNHIGFAHVVYPNGYKPGQRYPLVVVQYRSRGFLRGGTGNEYPIYPLSDAGFAVLSVDWPNYASFDTETVEEITTTYRRNGRALVWSAIEGAIDKVIAEGLVDPKRMALTGLSGGAEDVHYVLPRSNRFAAAIASSGMHDLTFFALVPEGPNRTRLMEMFDTTSVIPPAENEIYNLAWSNKPEKLQTPLLINVGDREAMIGFEGLQSIIHIGGPLEMRVFPDEQHIKYHPQSYAGIYENNLMWLNFWLKGKEDPRSEFAEQYRRWEAMKDRLNSEKAPSH